MASRGNRRDYLGQRKKGAGTKRDGHFPGGKGMVQKKGWITDRDFPRGKKARHERMTGWKGGFSHFTHLFFRMPLSFLFQAVMMRIQRGAAWCPVPSGG